MLDKIPFGFNLIHSPNDLALEQRTVDLYLAKGVRLVSASAYLDLTTPLVQYRIHGIHRSSQGKAVCPNRIIAKVSREEVARKFFSPPAEKHLQRLLELGQITTEQAVLARQVPMAQDLTAEADSGGHTDNRPALCLFPTMKALRDEMTLQHDYGIPLRVGLAGGIATPESAAAAFAMGAAYILTGSINQACVEADTSPLVKKMLTEARQADVIMAPAADMFEMGVKVQVLKRGTMFSMRGSKLYDIYRTYDKFEDVPESQRKLIEASFLKCSFAQEWENTRNFFQSTGSCPGQSGGNGSQTQNGAGVPLLLGTSVAVGHKAAYRIGRLIFRYGAVRLWVPSTNGLKAPFWSPWKTAGRPPWP